MRPEAILRRWPVPIGTCALLAANVLLFAYVSRLGQESATFLRRWAMDSDRVAASLAGHELSPTVLFTLTTATFLHANWVHLLANMLFLGVFGERVERVLGSWRLLALYLLGGIAAAAVQIGMAPATSPIAIGSSGAVAALIGAYLALNPYAPLASLAPRAFRLPSESIPVALLAVWVVAQALDGLTALGSATITSVSVGGWWAHVGGLAAGLLLLPLIRLRIIRVSTPGLRPTTDYSSAYGRR